MRSPRDSPKANAICERVIGTIRRECLDWMIPRSANHLRAVLREWIAHYNVGRPHMSLGPGIPDRPHSELVPFVLCKLGLKTDRIRAHGILGGLHHEYALRAETIAGQ